MRNNIALLTLCALLFVLCVPIKAQQPSRARHDLDPVFHPAFKGTPHSGLGGPFLIQVKDSFFRKSASYPRGETLAEGTFLFVDINIFNNSDRPRQIPTFTLQDPRGKTHLTAIRARRSNKAVLAGQPLDPGAGTRGYLIFDVPLLSESETLPIRYKLLIANSRHIIDVQVYKKEE
jgi:Domain of unknown function (DUF4352)